jgi:hypothetical protein
MRLALQLLIILLAITILRQIIGYGYPLVGIDDANIYFRYVKNIVGGHGFVYNIGGEHVEGFTSFIWTLLLCVFYIISPAQLELITVIVCFLMAYHTVYLVANEIGKRTGNGMLALATGSLLIVIPGFTDWNVLSMMETCLWVYASTLAGICILNKNYGFSFYLLIAALPLIRPEGMAVSLVFIGLKALNVESGYFNVVRIIKENILLLIAFAVPLSLLILFRKDYFGYPLPNTYYAKVSGSPIDNIINGGIYTAHAILSSPALAVLFCVVFYKLVRNLFASKFKISHRELIGLYILFTFALPFLTGGDHFAYYRYYQSCLPLLLIIGAELLYEWWGTKYIKYTWALAFLVQLRPYPVKFDMLAHSDMKIEVGIAMRDQEIANFCNAFFKGNLPEVGATTVGGWAYRYDGNVNDLLGLNNVAMAHSTKKKTGVKDHESFDADIFFQQIPDALLLEMKGDEDRCLRGVGRHLSKADRSGNNIFLKDVFHDTRFFQHYQVAKISKEGKNIYGFFSIKYIKSLPSNYQIKIYKLNNDQSAIVNSI